MTVLSEICFARLVSDGATTVFDTDFRVQGVADVAIAFENASGTTLSNVVSGFTRTLLSSGYVRIIFTTAPAAGWVHLTRATAALQQAALRDLSQNPAAVTEGALDKLTFMIQELSRKILDLETETGRCLRVPMPNSVSAFALAASRANTLAGFDADGDARTWSRDDLSGLAQGSYVDPVAEFHVVPDVEESQSVKMQAAIDAAIARKQMLLVPGGGTIWLGPKEAGDAYALQIENVSGFSMVGAGAGLAKFKVLDESYVGPINLASCSDILISGIDFDGNATGNDDFNDTGLPPGRHCLRFGGDAARVRLENCDFTDGCAYAVGWQGNNDYIDITVNNCRVNGCQADGFDFKNRAGGNQGINISNCVLRDTGRRGRQYPAIDCRGIVNLVNNHVYMNADNLGDGIDDDDVDMDPVEGGATVGYRFRRGDEDIANGPGGALSNVANCVADLGGAGATPSAAAGRQGFYFADGYITAVNCKAVNGWCHAEGSDGTTGFLVAGTGYMVKLIGCHARDQAYGFSIGGLTEMTNCDALGCTQFQSDGVTKLFQANDGLVVRADFTADPFTPRDPSGTTIDGFTADGFRRAGVVSIAGGSTAAVKASSRIFFDDLPDPGDTITFNGTVVTFVASGATGNQINIPASSTNQIDLINACVTFLNASVNANIAVATYSLSSIYLGILHDTAGTAGNAYTLAKSGANIRLFAATLTGGRANSEINDLEIRNSKQRNCLSGVTIVSGVNYRYRNSPTLGPDIRTIVHTGGTVNLTANDASEFAVHTNIAATSRVDYNLPAAAEGLRFTIYNIDADGSRITALSGTTIRLGTALTSTNRRIDTTALGEFVTLLGTGSTTWTGLPYSAGWTPT